MALGVITFLRHQQQRFMRPDAARYLRPDALRFWRPDSAKAEIYPALSRKWDGQPHIPAGQDGAGRFTFGRQGDSGLARVYITGRDDVGDGGAGQDDGDNFGNDLQLAGDPPDGLGGPSEEPPKIPDNAPNKSSQRTALFRSIASFLGRNTGLVADVFVGLMNEIDWITSYQDLIQAARDPPQTLRVLQSNVGKGRPGYEDHHISEQTAAERWGLPRSQIDDPSNLVSIPRLKHYQITGWYMTKNKEFGGLTPREYLSDKSLEERRAVGLRALRLFEVLKP